MNEFSQSPKRALGPKVKTIVTAAVSLIIGLVLVIWPETSGRVIAYFLAGLIALCGLIHIGFEYFRRAAFLPFPGLAVGLTVLSIGVFLIIKLEILLNILPVVLGIFLIYLGFVMLETAYNFYRLHVARWWIPGAFALLTLILGFLSLFNVFARILMVFLGISLIVEGVLQIVSMILFRKDIPVSPAPDSVSEAAPENPSQPPQQ